MKVRECMSLNICCCKPDEAVCDVAKKMNEVCLFVIQIIMSLELLQIEI